MIVTLDQRLFELGAPALLDAMRFVLAAIERRHVLLMDPAWDPEDNRQPVHRWLGAMPEVIIEAVHKKMEESLDEAANMGASVSRIRAEPIPRSKWNAGVLSREDALRLMQTPLWLVLENGRNDLMFLRRILERKDRDALDEHLAEGRVEVPLGGGTGELKVFLENLATLPDAPSQSRETTSWIRRLRSWVMFDRDAHPDDRSKPSKISESLRELCAQMMRPRPFPGHQLGRRTIENYLPIEALHAWAVAGGGAEKRQRREQVEAFKSDDFGAQRRACFEMKEGFVKDVANAIRDDLKQHKLKQRKLTQRKLKQCKLTQRARWLDEHELPTVFQGLQNTELRNHLNRGFGDKIAALYGDPAMDDRWFWRVFEADADAQAWRKRLVESLWAVL